MAKQKQKAAKTPKKRSTKYGKLAAVCSKELAAKKAALVRAEKALAKAQKSHTELLSEVARLDMLDRSLKALINGTEPPQNVKYVYSYPQWVWYGNPYGWYWNGYTWTVTLGAQNPTYVYGNLQGGQWTNANTVTTTNAVNTVYTTPSVSNVSLSIPSCDASAGGLESVYSMSSNALQSGTTLSSSATSSPTWQTFSASGALQQGAALTTTASSDFTVDLSTGAGDPEAEEPAEAKAAAATAGGSAEPEED